MAVGGVVVGVGATITHGLRVMMRAARSRLGEGDDRYKRQKHGNGKSQLHDANPESLIVPEERRSETDLSCYIYTTCGRHARIQFFGGI